MAENENYGPSLRNQLERAEVAVVHRADGSMLLKHPAELLFSGDLVLDRLHKQAAAHSGRVFLREKRATGWRAITYVDFVAQMEDIATRLHSLGLCNGQIAVFAAENSIDHALLSFATMRCGGVVAPIAPQMIAAAPNSVRAICDDLRAALLVTDNDASALGCNIKLSVALEGNWREQLERQVGACSTPSTGDNSLEFVPQADTIAKIMFTSGSTGTPKPIVNTHRMLSASQDIQNALFDPIRERQDRVYTLTDWLPWHHTYGGNSNLHGVIWAAGTLTIDRGKPLSTDFHATIAALRAYPPTVFVGVPASFALLADALVEDPVFASEFFESVVALVNGGAALPVPVADRLQELAVRETGERILIGGGYGMTETSAIITQIYWPDADPGTLGLPPPGLELKLVPCGEDRFEARIRGPNVTPGYYSADGPVADGLFDDEGFLQTGDAVRFIDAERPEAGLAYAGRLKEEFKLQSGSWVRVEQLRNDLLQRLGSIARDAVIVGENERDVRALVWLGEDATPASLQARFRAVDWADASLTRRISAVLPLQTAPDPHTGELVPKGSLNQLVMRHTRTNEIDYLYGRAPGSPAS